MPHSRRTAAAHPDDSAGAARGDERGIGTSMPRTGWRSQYHAAGSLAHSVFIPAATRYRATLLRPPMGRRPRRRPADPAVPEPVDRWQRPGDRTERFIDHPVWAAPTENELV
jgi:hypothetical protein